MSKKQDAFYFDSFVTCADYACRAAQQLQDVMKDFHPEQLKAQLDDMHKIEHTADEKKHEMLAVLAGAFITPIEREDIVTLSHDIDEMTDHIEDVLLRIYCNNVQAIRPESFEVVEILIRACDEAKLLLTEFSDFKHSKSMHEHIISLNTLEEEADRLFIANMRTLHTTVTDPIQIITWREIYIYLEKCVDSCEHVADIVESVAMKNS